jgi:hypothetical protein
VAKQVTKPVRNREAPVTEVTWSDGHEHHHSLDQPHGVRDCTSRDPADNLIRINELRQPSGDSQP